MASAILQSIPAGSSATNTTAKVLNNGGGAKLTGFVAVCTGSSGISAGAAQLQVSPDGTHWVVAAIPVAASSTTSATILGQYQYAKAVITTAIVGGTVGITVQNV